MEKKGENGALFGCVSTDSMEEEEKSKKAPKYGVSLH